MYVVFLFSGSHHEAKYTAGMSIGDCDCKSCDGLFIFIKDILFNCDV